MRRVYDQQRELVFQHVVDRAPVDARALQRNVGTAGRPQPLRQLSQCGGRRPKGADLLRPLALRRRVNQASDYGLLVHIQPATARMQDVHPTASSVQSLRVAGMQVSRSPESHLRASQPGATGDGAARHPGQTGLRARGTRQNPAVCAAPVLFSVVRASSRFQPGWSRHAAGTTRFQRVLVS